MVRCAATAAVTPSIGRVEGREERVALGLDDDPALTLDSRPEDLVVPPDQRGPSRGAHGALEPCGPFDVGEQERDGGAGRKCHGRCASWQRRGRRASTILGRDPADRSGLCHRGSSLLDVRIPPAPDGQRTMRPWMTCARSASVHTLLAERERLLEEIEDAAPRGARPDDLRLPGGDGQRGLRAAARPRPARAIDPPARGRRCGARAPRRRAPSVSAAPADARSPRSASRLARGRRCASIASGSRIADRRRLESRLDPTRPARRRAPRG